MKSPGRQNKKKPPPAVVRDKTSQDLIENTEIMESLILAERNFDEMMTCLKKRIDDVVERLGVAEEWIEYFDDTKDKKVETTEKFHATDDDLPF